MVDEQLLAYEIQSAAKILSNDARILQSLKPHEIVDTVTNGKVQPDHEGILTTGRFYDAHYRLLDGSLMQVHVMVSRRWKSDATPMCAGELSNEVLHLEGVQAQPLTLTQGEANNDEVPHRDQQAAERVSGRRSLAQRLRGKKS